MDQATMVYFFQDNNFQKLDGLYLQYACWVKIWEHSKLFNELPLYCKKYHHIQDEYINF